MRPTVFIGSSSEGLKIAKIIQLALDHLCDVTIWSQGVFGLGQGTLESLVLALDKYDFAILILTPDDLTISRDDTIQSPRDNVLFELGLFVGGLGRDRTFIIYDRSKKIKVPTDLAGITVATFQEHSDGNLQASLGAPCTQIELAIEKLGVKENKRYKELSNATKDVEDVKSKFSKMIQLLARSRKVELDIISTQFGPMINKNHLEQMRKDLEDLSSTLNNE